MDLRHAIAHAASRRSFSAAEMAEVFGCIMDGLASPAQIAALLMALRMKGETVDEIVGAARAMRARATPMLCPDGVVPLRGIDTCGTGGDSSSSLNVSTLAALTAAACGLTVAKHGNRAQSSRAGSADLLEALGVNLSASVPQVERCLREAGMGFLFAPAFHGATRHAAAARREMGVRTLFNLLGPLTNPAQVRHQVVGVYDPALVAPLCQALADLGAERAMVVHGTHRTPDGRTLALDEVSPTGETQVAEWHAGRLRCYVLRQEDFGLEQEAAAGSNGLDGGEPAHNAALALALLGGEAAALAGAGGRAVVMTVACALQVAGVCGLQEGAQRALEALRSGRARAVLAALVRLSHEEIPG